MMEHAEIRDRLDGFVDGDLAAEEHRAVREHLDGCDACREEVEGLVALLADARALPREAAPPRDLWPGIAERLRDPKVIEVDFTPARRLPGRWAPLAAAAVALVVLSSGLTVFLMSGGTDAPVALAPAAAGPPEPRPTTALAAFAPAETEYLGTVETLQAALDERRPALQPSTVAIIEENLRIIDQAIAEARAALAEDPGNADLPHMLSGVYRKKVELLESAIRLPIQS